MGVYRVSSDNKCMQQVMHGQPSLSCTPLVDMHSCASTYQTPTTTAPSSFALHSNWQAFFTDTPYLSFIYIERQDTLTHACMHAGAIKQCYSSRQSPCMSNFSSVVQWTHTHLFDNGLSTANRTSSLAEGSILATFWSSLSLSNVYRCTP